MYCCEISFVYNYVKKLMVGKFEIVIFFYMLLFLRIGWGFFLVGESWWWLNGGNVYF